MYTAFKFSSASQVAKAMLRWWSLPRYKRAAAIVKQHGLSDASEIFHRDSKGKCYGMTTFVGEYDGRYVVFDYFGTVMFDDAQYPEYMTNDVEALTKMVLDTKLPDEEDEELDIEDEPDYSPSSPWNAPGMSPSDFIR